MFYCSRLTVAFSGLFPTIGSKIITEPSSPEDSHVVKVTSNLTDGATMPVSRRIATSIFNVPAALQPLSFQHLQEQSAAVWGASDYFSFQNPTVVKAPWHRSRHLAQPPCQKATLRDGRL
jgi:hypothetical protein